MGFYSHTINTVPSAFQKIPPTRLWNYVSLKYCDVKYRVRRVYIINFYSPKFKPVLVFFCVASLGAMGYNYVGWQLISLSTTLLMSVLRRLPYKLYTQMAIKSHVTYAHFQPMGSRRKSVDCLLLKDKHQRQRLRAVWCLLII